MKKTWDSQHVFKQSRFQCANIGGFGNVLRKGTMVLDLIGTHSVFQQVILNFVIYQKTPRGTFKVIWIWQYRDLPVSGCHCLFQSSKYTPWCLLSLLKVSSSCQNKVHSSDDFWLLFTGLFFLFSQDFWKIVVGLNKAFLFYFLGASDKVIICIFLQFGVFELTSQNVSI